MLSYQHAYHAGGPADVHKHAALAAAAGYLAKKERPFAALDVFAGEGRYDLTEAMAQKTGEYRQGIAALWNGNGSPPPAVAKLLMLVRDLNGDGALRHYPGSPHVLKALLRADDKLIVNELHPAAIMPLRRWARGDDRITIHQRDGLEALTALVPPSIRRGLAVIDPSYESADEYAATGAAVVKAAKKWPEGTFFVWYPMLADERHVPLVAAIEKELTFPTVVSELVFDLPGLADSPKLGLRGSGILMVNPPWQIDLALRQNGEWLASALPLGKKARHDLRWIHPQT